MMSQGIGQKISQTTLSVALLLVEVIGTKMTLAVAMLTDYALLQKVDIIREGTFGCILIVLPTLNES